MDIKFIKLTKRQKAKKQLNNPIHAHHHLHNHLHHHHLHLLLNHARLHFYLRLTHHVESK